MNKEWIKNCWRMNKEWAKNEQGMNKGKKSNTDSESEENLFRHLPCPRLLSTGFLKNVGLPTDSSSTKSNKWINNIIYIIIIITTTSTIVDLFLP